MPYITMPAPVRYPQLSLDDYLNMPIGAPCPKPVGHAGDTKTFFAERTPEKYCDPARDACRIRILQNFAERHKSLYAVSPRSKLYHHFNIRKRNGKLRPIDQPNEELMTALRELKLIFENEFQALHHTAAFAYVKHRSALDAVRRHQSNDSKWVLKTDLSGFFPSTNFAFTMQMLSMVYPFSEVMRYPAGEAALEKAIDLCFLNDSLPQGTPISPMLTNLIMIPVDHALFNKFRDEHLIYTRYADDMDISSRTDFDWCAACETIRSTFASFSAPYELKNEKTHYGNRNGRNWMLGVMYNKDGVITLGYKRKRELRAMIADYIRRRGTPDVMPLDELQSLNGQIAYFKKVEPDYTDGCLEHYNKKFRINVLNSLRSDIKNA